MEPVVLLLRPLATFRNKHPEGMMTMRMYRTLFQKEQKQNKNNGALRIFHDDKNDNDPTTDFRPEEGQRR